MSNSPFPQAPNLCISCSKPLEGTYCHHCGEKRIEPEKDYNIFHYVRETLEQFLNFDAKVLRSYGLFISQPGQLTKAWIEGLRKPYIKPLSLFLTVAVGVHFFLPTTNVYFELLDEIREGYATGNPLQNIVGYGLSLRKVYGKSGIIVQFMRFLGSLCALIACIILYRQLVTILTVWQM